MLPHVDHANPERIPLEACIEKLHGRREAVGRLQGGHTHFQEELRILYEVANEQGWFREASGTFLKATWPRFFGWAFRRNPVYKPV